MSDNRISAVLVGYGRWGRVLHQTIADSCQFRVDGVVSPRIYEDSSLEEQCMRFTSLEDALSQDRFEAAFVAVPPRISAAIVEMALRHGLDVFAEKPVAQSSEEASLLCGTAKRFSSILYVDYTYRFHWLIEGLTSNSESHGKILEFEFRVGDPVALSKSAEVLWLWGPHLCSVFGDVFADHAPSSARVLTDSCLQVLSDEASVRLKLASSLGYSGILNYSLQPIDKLRQLVVTRESGQTTLDLLEPPPTGTLTALSKSVATFARYVRERNSSSGDPFPCEHMCFGITSLLEQAMEAFPLRASPSGLVGGVHAASSDS